MSLSCDDLGVILTCPDCGTGNRIAYARLGQKGRCGSCQKPLPFPDQPVEIDSAASFAALTAGSPLPVVVDFWAPWCGPCRTMAPEFAKAAHLAAGEAVFAKVDTEQQPGIASQFRIQGIPAFLLFEGGRVIRQGSGARPAAALLTWMRQG